MDDRSWTEGMTKLVGAFPNSDITPEAFRSRGGLYREELDELTGEEWLRAVKSALRGCRFFPSIADLLGYAKPAEPTEAQAVAVFEQVIECREYRPNGSIWLPRTIRAKVGPAALEAYMAAGGRSAFVWMPERDLPFTRKKFVEAYTAAVRLDPRLALPEAKKPELTA